MGAPAGSSWPRSSNSSWADTSAKLLFEVDLEAQSPENGQAVPLEAGCWNWSGFFSRRTNCAAVVAARVKNHRRDQEGEAPS